MQNVASGIHFGIFFPPTLPAVVIGGRSAFLFIGCNEVKYCICVHFFSCTNKVLYVCEGLIRVNVYVLPLGILCSARSVGP